MNEIEDIRGRIEGNLRQLEDRVPNAGLWARRAAMALGGLVGLLVLRRIWKGIRSRGGGLDEDSWVLVRLRDLEELSDEPISVVVEED
ncbi:MAG TPA: hypothetical protein VHL78_01700 [Actinomycetota bacterium]|nr:hypothetical protein [Actinomycetota bacterium]